MYVRLFSTNSSKGTRPRHNTSSQREKRMLVKKLTARAIRNAWVETRKTCSVSRTRSRLFPCRYAPTRSSIETIPMAKTKAKSITVEVG